MNLKYKNEILVAILLVITVVAFYYLYAILLPFVIGLVLAFWCLPLVNKIQKLVKVRALATSLFLAACVGLTVLFVVLLGNYVNKDFKRLATSFQVLSSHNKDKLTTAEVKIKEYITVFYDTDQLESSLKLKADSASQVTTSGSFGGIDTQAIEDSFAKITDGFGSKSADEATKKSSIGIISILLMSVSYFVLILFNIEYFDALRKRYVGKKTASQFNTVLSDFNQSFVKYFTLRGKIILILSLIYLPVFIILNLPGALLFTFLILLLSFIPYLQYLVLIPASVACLALSTESNQPFLFNFGIVVGTFVLASIIEEFVLNPRIMEKNIGINPVIMVLSISVWTYVLGMPGLIIGLPLTCLCLIYLKRYVEPLVLKVKE